MTTADNVGRVSRSCKVTGTPTSVTANLFDSDVISDGGRIDYFREQDAELADFDLHTSDVRRQELVALLKAASRTGTPYIGCCFLRSTDARGYSHALEDMDEDP